MARFLRSTRAWTTRSFPDDPGVGGATADMMKKTAPVTLTCRAFPSTSKGDTSDSSWLRGRLTNAARAWVTGFCKKDPGETLGRR